MERVLLVRTAALLMAVARLPAADGPPKYAGSEKCRACHAAFYDRWSTSRHGLAMQPFTPDFARRNLTTNTQPIHAGRAQYIVDLSDKGATMREASDKA